MTQARRRMLMVAAGAAALGTLATRALAQQSQQRNKVVIQVSDDGAQKWNLVLNNARNLQEDVGAANVDMEIVVYGPGIGMLKSDSPVAPRIADALKAGIKVVACENTMRGQKLAKSDMLPAIGYVPSGVVELMKKQQEGFAYLRP